MILDHPSFRNPPSFGLRLPPALAVVALCLWSGSAKADFRLCNNTSSRVGIALGYKDAEGWTTEGWWNVSSRSCETLLKGTLVARFYYIYALDYDRGGEWSGQAFMCSRDKEFTIKGTEQPAQQRVPGIPGTVGPGGNVPGLPSPPGSTPPGASGLPPAATPGPKP